MKFESSYFTCMDEEALEEEDIMLDAGEGEGPTTVEEGAGDGAA